MDAVESRVKVSVCVITHNQVRYIRECLQSILDQKTSFAFDVIVGDDCSTDGTREIVESFARDFPGVVKPLLHRPHVGGTANYFSVHRAATGEYIAHMDGDDYMLPGKLQIQADALDANPDCTICAHDVKRLDEFKHRFVEAPHKTFPRKSDVAFLLMNLPFFTHSSKMYRTACDKGLETLDTDTLDCYFHVHHALAGDILYLDEILGVYRLNVGLSTDSADTRATLYRAPDLKSEKLWIAALEHARQGGVDPALVTRAKAKVLFDLSYSLLMAKQFRLFRSYIARSLATAKLDKRQSAFGLFAPAPRLLFWLVRARAAARTRFLARAG